MKAAFYQLIQNYTDNQVQIEKLWLEIESNYSKKSSHYHTLKHLENMYRELTFCCEKIDNWENVLFALFYHDLVYDAKRNDNEEKSAETAKKRMEMLGLENNQIKQVESLILATKKHTFSNDYDVNLFTDCDLSILGQNWEIYWEYAQNVRKEYKIYPDLLYIPGRKKVLQHFLEMESIFKTEEFQKRYEIQAKENLLKELNLL